MALLYKKHIISRWGGGVHLRELISCPLQEDLPYDSYSS
jgi:hypothetical protein